MKRSLLQSVRQCYVCNSLLVEKHHIFFGRANRDKSEEDGCWVWLCPEHHRSERGVHGAMGARLKHNLQRKARLEWCRRYDKSTEEFIQRYGRSYLFYDPDQDDEDNAAGGYPYA